MQDARDAVVQDCERQFEELFGVPFTNDIRTGWRAEFARLQGEDADARKVLTGGRATRAKALAVVKRHGLDPAIHDIEDLPGHAPTLGTLFMMLQDEDEDWRVSIRDLREDSRPPRFDHRAWVVSTFEMLWIRAKPTPCGEISWRPDPTSGVPRYLTDHELAVISVLMAPTVIVLQRGKDGRKDSSVTPTVGELLDRERRAIKHKRRLVGEQRTAEEDAAAKKPPRGYPKLPEV